MYKRQVERRMGIPFEPIRPFKFTERGDRIGWVKGIDNNWHLTQMCIRDRFRGCLP